MSMNCEFMNQENNFNEINNINKDISPMENLNFNFPSSIDISYKEPLKKKKFPNYPIKNIYQPELFLEQEYIENFICGICENVCNDAVIQMCGCEQIFCRKCLLFYYENNQHKCPQCNRKTLEPKTVEAVNVAIKIKKMKCKNYIFNCNWQGQCRDYKNHITKNCPKEIINCPYKGCVVKLRREEMDEHMANCEYLEYICKKCNLKMPIHERNNHIEECLKEKINCPQGCGIIIERGDFNIHKQNCINSYIECPYNFLGCGHKFIRKDQEKFLNEYMSNHLDLAVKRIKELEKFRQISKNLEIEVKELRLFKEKNQKKKIEKEKINNTDNEKNLIENYLFYKKSKSISIFSKPKGEIITILESKNINDAKNENLIQLSENENNIENKKKNNTENEKKDKKLRIITDKIKYLSNKRKSSSNSDSFNSFFSNSNITKYSNKNISSNSSKTRCIDSDEECYSDNNIIINQEDKIYDLIESTKDFFKINGNIIETKCLKGKKQYYVFFNQKYNIPKTSKKKYIIKFKLLKDTQWLGIGLCDKKIVEKNNYEFTPPKRKDGKRPNIGTYIVSTNKMAWNCNNSKQCRKFMQTIYKENTIIECVLSPIECELDFITHNNLIIKFNDVRCFKSDYFSPCLIFLQNCKVETTFYYP